MKDLENFYYQKDEPIQSCLLALRRLILKQDPEITEAWKYGIPFFCYNGKMYCYLWVHKKFKQPYLGIVEGRRIDHPKLIIEKRSRMKIMLFDSGDDLPIAEIRDVLQQALVLSRKPSLPRSKQKN